MTIIHGTKGINAMDLDIVIETKEYFPETEMWLFESIFPFPVKISVYIRETSETYFYTTKKVFGSYWIVTE